MNKHMRNILQHFARFQLLRRARGSIQIIGLTILVPLSPAAEMLAATIPNMVVKVVEDQYMAITSVGKDAVATTRELRHGAEILGRDIKATALIIKEAGEIAVTGVQNSCDTLGTAVTDLGQAAKQSAQIVATGANTLGTTFKESTQIASESIKDLGQSAHKSAELIGKGIEALSDTKHEIGVGLNLSQDSPILIEHKLDLNQTAWLRMGAGALATGTFFTSLALIYASLTREQSMRQKVTQGIAGAIGVILSIAWLDVLRQEALKP